MLPPAKSILSKILLALCQTSSLLASALVRGNGQKLPKWRVLGCSMRKPCGLYHVVTAMGRVGIAWRAIHTSCRDCAGRP